MTTAATTPYILRVDLHDKRSYDIRMGAGAINHAGRYLSDVLPSKKICVVTDENVAKHYLINFTKNLESAGFVPCPPIILPAGESSKNVEQWKFVTNKALSYKIDRHSALAALGGGVIGDITGFAASTLLRGIPYIQVPTTLLAQVDSSVGGKTGINTPHGKNLVGSFYQPRLVLIDTSTINTLDMRERKSGYAEILKYALINNPQFFEWLEENGESVVNGDPDTLLYAIKTSCAAKADIVSTDEREEKDHRALLNLGHTYGHALEAIGGYDGRLLHGEAVGIGMYLAFRYAANIGLCSEAEVEKILAHLTHIGLMTFPPFPVSAKDMITKMRHDKKNQDGKLTLILTRGIGQAYVAHNIDEHSVLTALEKEPWIQA